MYETDESDVTRAIQLIDSEGNPKVEYGTLESIRHAVTTTALSTGAQLVDIPTSIGNMFGRNDELIDIEHLIYKQLGVDSAQYYKQNKEGVDVAGFVVSSFVPGMAGVKGLQAGQAAIRAAEAGKEVHPYLRLATGLVAPKVEANLATVRLTSKIDQTASMTRKDSLRAIAVGGQQNLLETIAFEAALIATMAQGEVLGEMTTKEMLTNAAVATGFGGAIGVGFAAFAVRGANKAGLENHAALWNKYSAEIAPSSNAPEAVKAGVAISRLNQLTRNENITTIGKAVEDANLALDDTAKARVVSALNSNMIKLKESYENTARNNLMSITQNDRTMTEFLLHKWKNVSDADLEDDMLGLSQILPSGKTSKVEQAMAKEAKDFTKTLELSPIDYKVNHVDLVTGSILPDKPNYTSIQDMGAEIKIQGDTVVVGKQRYKVHTDININPPKPDLLTPRELEARAYWISKQKKEVFTKAQSIAEHDFASIDNLLYRVRKGELSADDFKDGVIRIRQVAEDGQVKFKTVSLVDDIENFKIAHFSNKLDAAKAMIDHRRNKSISGINVEEQADLLRRISGINFKLADPDLGEISSNAAGTFNMGSKIVSMNKKVLATKTLRQNLHTLLHEYGHNRDDAVKALQKGNQKRLTTDASKAEAIKLSKQARPGHWRTVAQMEKAIARGETLDANAKHFIDYMYEDAELIADARSMLSLAADKTLSKYPNLVNEFGSSLYRAHDDIQRIYGYDALTRRIPDEALLRGLNLHPAAMLKDPNDIIAAGELDKVLFNRETRATEVFGSEFLPDEFSLPFYHKLTYDGSTIKIDENEARGMGKLMSSARAYAMESEAVGDAVIGEKWTKFMPTAMGDFMTAFEQTVDAYGTGGKFFAASNRDYGHVGSFTKLIGATGLQAKQAVDKEVNELFASSMQKLVDEPDLASGWGILNNQLRRRPYEYALDADNNRLVVKSLMEAEKAKAAGKEVTMPDIPEDMMYVDLTKLVSKVENVKPLMDLVTAHIERNGKTISDTSKLRNVLNGVSSNLEGKQDVFYPMPPDTKNKPFVAFVFDNSIKNGRNHSSVLYAANQKELDTYIANIESNPAFDGTLKVRRQQEVTDYYKSIGEFDADKQFDSTELRHELIRKGLDAPFEAITDGNVLTRELVNFHANASKANINLAIESKYAGIFNSLKKLATNHETKPLAGSGKQRDMNPYESYTKEMLGMSVAGQYQTWKKMGDVVENVFTSVHDEVYGSFKGVKVSEDMLLEASKKLKENGFQGAFVAPATMELANRQVETHIASKFVSAINGLTSFFVLRMDPLHAINNLIGHNVVYNAELRDVIKRVGTLDPHSKIFNDLNTKLPGGEGSVLSQGKLVSQAVSDFWSRADLRELYTDIGFNLDISKQIRAMLDEVAIDVGRETTESITKKHTALMDRLRQSPEVIEKYSLNKFSEEMTNFVSARTMHIIAEEAARVGAISSDAIWTYVNTFTNRVRGTYIAAQRPALFQGPVGMSMALFQTYQLNLMQQLFRYSSEGRMNTSAVMMGLQASLYGAHGVPGYHAVNSYVANAEGNNSKSDITGQMYQMFDTKGADWAMYGLASNFPTVLGAPGINLFTRGDLNPREITVIPINPLDAPWVAGWSKFLGNLYDSGAKLSNGADAYDVIARGLEHNGLSRPLAGLGRVLQGAATEDNLGYSTTRDGKLVATFDLASMASLYNLAGGKSLDEAKALDALYRMKAYNQDKKDDMASLKQLLRLHASGNSTLDPEVYKDFLHKYAGKGGDITRFNQFYFDAIKEANESSLKVMGDINKSPYGRDFQAIIGGDLQELYPQM